MCIAITIQANSSVMIKLIAQKGMPIFAKQNPNSFITLFVFLLEISYVIGKLMNVLYVRIIC